MNYWVENIAHGGRSGKVTRIYIYDTLGNSHQTGATSQNLARDLAAARDNRVDLHLHSEGGSAEAALQMHALLSDHGNVVAYIDGDCHSGASVLAQAGTLRHMDRNATIMIHKPHVPRGFMPKDRASRQAAQAILDDVETRVARIYAARSGKGTVVDWKKLMAADTVFNAENALRAGLVDQIVGSNVSEPPMVALHREVVAIGGRW